jgi:hypothetical protein
MSLTLSAALWFIINNITTGSLGFWVAKKELKRIHIDGCRYNERLNSKTEGSKLLVYTGLVKKYIKPSSGHTVGGRRPGQTWKKQKDLSACDRGCGEGGGVCSRKNWIIVLSKSWYQSFWGVLIDLMFGFLSLIIKTFDNQTEMWSSLSIPLIINLFEILDDNHDYFVYKTFAHKSNKPD